MMLIPDIDPHGDSTLHYDGDFTYKDCSSGCIDTLIRGREYVAYVNQTMVPRLDCDCHGLAILRASRSLRIAKCSFQQTDRRY
jgi:hypothetical protein